MWRKTSFIIYCLILTKYIITDPHCIYIYIHPPCGSMAVLHTSSIRFPIWGVFWFRIWFNQKELIIVVLLYIYTSLKLRKKCVVSIISYVVSSSSNMRVVDYEVPNTSFVARLSAKCSLYMVVRIYREEWMRVIFFVLVLRSANTHMFCMRTCIFYFFYLSCLAFWNCAKLFFCDD